MSVTTTVVASELRQFFRQPIAVALMVIMPLWLPGLIKAIDAYDVWFSESSGEVEREKKRKAPLPISADAAARELLEGAKRLTIVEGVLPTQGAIGKDGPLATVAVEDHTATILYRDDVARSERAADKVEAAFERLDDEALQAALHSAGRTESVEELLEVVTHDVALAEESSGSLALLLPSLLLLSLTAFGTFTGLDMVAGEKERGTGETLLSTAAPRQDLLLGKALAVALLTVSTALLGVAALGVASMAGMELQSVVDGPLLLPPVAWAALVATALMLGLQISAASVVLGASVPDYRTGSLVASPFILLLMTPPMIASAPGVTLSPLAIATPVLGPVLALRNAMNGTLLLVPALATLVATVVHTAGAIAWATHRFNRPDALIPSSGAPARRALGDYRLEVGTLFAFAFIGYWYLAVTAMSVDMVGGLLLGQLGVLVPLAIGGVWWTGLEVRDTLSLRRPGTLDLGVATILGLTMWCLAAGLMALLEPLLPVSSAWAESMNEALQMGSYPIVVMWAVIALLPGVCEELLFRGALLGLLRKRVSDPTAIAVVAVLFGLLHMSLVRMPTTTLIGVFLGVLAVHSRSLFPAMLAHVINNALLTTLGRAGVEPSGPVLAAGGLVALGTTALYLRQPAADATGTAAAP